MADVSINAAFDVVWEGILFPTALHAIAWSAFLEEGKQTKTQRIVRGMIRRAKSPLEAIHIFNNHQNDLRSDWETVRGSIFTDVCATRAARHQGLHDFSELHTLTNVFVKPLISLEVHYAD